MAGNIDNPIRKDYLHKLLVDDYGFADQVVEVKSCSKYEIFIYDTETLQQQAEVYFPGDIFTIRKVYWNSDRSSFIGTNRSYAGNLCCICKKIPKN